MKRILLTLLFVALVTIPSFSGTLGADPRTYSVLVAHEKGIGSGMVIQMSNSVYLVTAKHVLFAPAEGTNAPALLSASAVIKGYSPDGTNDAQRELAIGLAQLLSAKEIRCSSNRDVVLVRIEDCSSNNNQIVRPLPGVTILTAAGNLVVPPESVICRAKDIDVGGDVIMFGYPVSLTGGIADIFDPSEPLLRKGIVAGVNLAKSTVIIDCPSYFGNSGGPVIEIDRSHFGMEIFRVVGLVSGFIPFQEEWENKTMGYSHVIKSNSGYTVVEPMDTVLELVWK